MARVELLPLHLLLSVTNFDMSSPREHWNKPELFILTKHLLEVSAEPNVKAIPVRPVLKHWCRKRLWKTGTFMKVKILSHLHYC